MHDDLILRVLQVLASSPDSAEDEVVAALVADGVGRVRAEKLAALVPLAFGRVLIAHMASVSFSTHALVGHPSGERVDLRSEPLFLRALEIATRLFHEGPRHLFQPAATMSAELQAVNNALNSGVKDLSGSTFADPILMRLTAKEWRDDG